MNSDSSANDGKDKDDGSYDRLRRRVLWTMPTGLYVVGSRDGERRNLMTLNWAVQVSLAPKQIGIGVLKTAVTHELIEKGRAFSLNILSKDDRAIVRKFVKPVTDEGTTLNGFPVHNAISGVPILDQAVAFVECQVAQTVDTGDHTFFIGLITNCGFQRDEKTPILCMEDTRMNYGG